MENEKLIELVCDALEDGCVGHCNYPYCYRVNNVVKNLIANGVVISNSETTTKWIPVTERLPDKYQLVLAACKNGKIFVGEYVDLGWRTLWLIRTARDSTKEITQIVTHWMPLPQPPKGE